MSNEKARRRNLGRGLDALLGGGADGETAPETRTEDSAPAGRDGPRQIPVDRIRSGRYQPRRRFDKEELDALAESIRRKGIVQPILLRPHPDEADAYELIAGERRWLAAQQAGLHEVPALVRALTDRDALEVAIVENIQRQDLTPLEEAQGYKRLIDEFGHTQEELAEVIGKSRAHIANMLRLLGLPESIRDMLHDGKLSAGHARALVTADQPEALAREIVAKGLSVREVEKRLQSGRPPKTESGGGKGGAARAGAGDEKDVDTVALEKDLANRLGLTVDIRNKGERGELVIHYRSLEQLDDVLARLSGGR